MCLRRYRVYNENLNFLQRQKVKLEWDIEQLVQILKQRTDGFLATTATPHETGLPVYVVFNCYGCGANPGRFPEPKRHRKVIVEVAMQGTTKNTLRKRFDWNKMIPIEVSGSPRILLTGRKLQKTTRLLSEQEWINIFSFIARHHATIEKHWLGCIDSGELLNTICMK